MANCAANKIITPQPQEQIACPLCQEQAYSPVYTVSDRLGQKLTQAKGEPQGETFSIVACSSCGFLYLNPRPIDPGRYYRAENYDPHRKSGGGLTGFLYHLLQPLSIGYKARMVTQRRNPGRLLDVGSGRGEFLSLMRRRGWQVMGIEKDPGAATSSQNAGNPTLIGDPLEVTFSENEFDLITFWHSLEHIPDLKGTVVRIAGKLQPGGVLAVAVPNPEGLDARYYGRCWVPWDAPRHLYHFRRQDMQTLWEPHGLRLTAMRSLPLDPFYAALLSEISWSSGSGIPLKAIRGVIIGSASFLAGLKEGQGSSIVYLFRKG
jgi:SAM-dependent methyltransferase